MPSRLRHHLPKQLFLALFACGAEQNMHFPSRHFIFNIALVEFAPALLDVAALAYVGLQVFGRVATIYAACTDERSRICCKSAVLELFLGPALLVRLFPSLTDVAPRVHLLAVQAAQGWLLGPDSIFLLHLKLICNGLWLPFDLRLG